MEKKLRGFTLIEMMITMLVLAILSAIAIPAYTDYIIRAQRAEGKAAANIVVQQLERCYSQFGRYNDAVRCPAAAAGATVDSEQLNYVVTITNLAATAYVVESAPVGTQLARDGNDVDGSCGTLTISQTGAVDIKGIAPPPDIDDSPNSIEAIQNCWDR